MMSEPCRCRFIGHIADLSALVGIKLCKPRDISCVFPCHPVTLLVILGEAKDLAADRLFISPITSICAIAQVNQHQNLRKALHRLATRWLPARVLCMQ